jgi:hypothetical protein
VQVATSTKLDRTTGKHFWKSVLFVKPTRAQSRKFCRKIWERTEEFVDLADEEKLKEECSLFTKRENNKNKTVFIESDNVV